VRPVTEEEEEDDFEGDVVAVPGLG
jgi:hypothetical protein